MKVGGWNKAEIRMVDRASIRKFMEDHRSLLRGKILDFGCGLPHRCVQVSPYKDLVEGEYVPYDVGYDSNRLLEPYTCVVINQVLQFVHNPTSLFAGFDTRYLLMTYATHWEEVEKDDMWRITKLGMEGFLKDAGYKILEHTPRWSVEFADFEWVGGYGVVACK